MKIGVLTFWNTQDNYGQVLQCFALIKTLEDIGHDAVLIKTKKMPMKTSFLHKFRTLYNSLVRGGFFSLLFCRNTSKNNRIEKSINRGFDDFRRRNIPSYDQIYTYEELCKSANLCDAYIVGSDQVWGALSPIMFLEFVRNGEKKLSYAASFGGFTPRDREEKKFLKRYLESFKLVTVREQEGVKKCADVGIQATLVPDPTLLLKRPAYKNLIEARKTKGKGAARPYVLLYLLGNKVDFSLESFYSFAKAANLEVKYVASQGREDEYAKIYPTIEEWLELYENASYIVTNSFHGTVFSIIFKKNFLTILLSGNFARMNGRVYNLLNQYNLLERIFSGDLNALYSPIDYTIVDRIIEDNSSFARELLKRKLDE